MKFFQHSTEDVGIWIGRCHYEASHGRVALALERNRELASEFPDNPHIVYDEGVIRRGYLGQGALAQDLFKRAYDLATERNVESTRWFASCNAAMLAPDEQEFREWAAIAMSLTPTEHSDKEFFAGCLSEIDRGVPYKGLLLTWGQDQESSGNLGCSAAYLEVALLMGGMAAHNEAQLTRSRAEKLRGLDRVAETQRETLSEAFPPEERLALHEALAAIEKAIALDPYDAVLWNLKSAWCNELGRYSESVESADRAIQLRPQRYPRPWISKALTLWPLGRDAEALACAQEALRQAEEMADEFPDDIERARSLVQRFSVPRQTPCLEELLPVVSRILAVTRMLSDEALGQMNAQMNPLVRGFLKRFQSVGGGRSVSYVPMVAQLLSDFPVEVGFCIALEASKRNIDVHGKCVYAAQYLVAHSEGIQQRDSARFFALNLFLRVQGGADLIRSTYREAILETSAVTTSPLSQVDAIMRKELGRINPLFPQLIADQEPLGEAERERGRKTITENFKSQTEVVKVRKQAKKGKERDRGQTHQDESNLPIFLFFGCSLVLFAVQAPLLASLILGYRWRWLSVFDGGLVKITLGLLLGLIVLSMLRASTRISLLPGYGVLSMPEKFAEYQRLVGHLHLAAVLFSMEACGIFLWGVLQYMNAVRTGEFFVTGWGKLVFLTACTVPFLTWFMQPERETTRLRALRHDHVRSKHGKLFGVFYSASGALWIGAMCALLVGLLVLRVLMKT